MENEELLEDEELEEETDESDDEELDVDVEEDEGEEDEDGEEDNTDEEEPKPESKKKQSAGERKAQAEARRKREAKERQSIEDKAYQRGVIQGLGGINPYTNDKIVDDIDYELYMEMKNAEEKGYDPTDAKELNQYRKEVKQEELKAKEAENKQNMDIANDLKSFSEKYPDIDSNELLKNEDFLKFAGDDLGSTPLSSLYRMFINSNSVATEKAKAIAIKSKARASASSGSMGDGDAGGGLYTAEELAKLTREEIEANYEKVQKSKEKNYYR